MYYYCLSIFIFYFDLISKDWVNISIDYFDIIKIVPGLNFTLIYNYDGMLGFFKYGSKCSSINNIIHILIVVLFLFWMNTISNRCFFKKSSLSLIIGGAIGNLYSKLKYGYVIDFIDLYCYSFHCCTFNFADFCICIGQFFLIVQFFKN